MTEKQYENVMRELAEIKELAWSKEGQSQLLLTLTELTNVMGDQAKVSKKQAEIFERMEKFLDDDYEPEPKILVS